MAKKRKPERKKPAAKDKAKKQPAQAAEELTDDQLDKVAGGVIFTSVSNVLKTRHDTAKNSISNVR